MTLNEAIERMKQEFPGKYVTVKIDDTWSPYNDKGTVIKWSVWVEDMKGYSDDSPNLDEAIASLKRKSGIDQPKPEGVEVS